MKINKVMVWGGYFLALFLLIITLKTMVSAKQAANTIHTETKILMEEAFSHIKNVDYVETESGIETVVYDNAGNTYVIDRRDAQIDKTEASKVVIFRTDTPGELKAMQEYIENNTAGNIIIEISNGTVTGENGDGETDSGYYIHYNGNYEVNDRVESAFIYNPATQYIDDVLYRQDTKIQ